jgi:hypothetical protein
LKSPRSPFFDDFLFLQAIVAGNPKLNLAFVANLFNTCPGLAPLTEAEKAALGESISFSARRLLSLSIGCLPACL